MKKNGTFEYLKLKIQNKNFFAEFISPKNIWALWTSIFVSVDAGYTSYQQGDCRVSRVAQDVKIFIHVLLLHHRLVSKQHLLFHSEASEALQRVMTGCRLKCYDPGILNNACSIISSVSRRPDNDEEPPLRLSCSPALHDLLDLWGFGQLARRQPALFHTCVILFCDTSR